MGVDLCTYGIVDSNDKEFNKMKDVAVSCCKADVEFPKEVKEYLDKLGLGNIFVDNSEEASEKLEDEIQVRLPKECCEEIDGCGGMIIDLSKLPKNIKKIVTQMR